MVASCWVCWVLWITSLVFTAVHFHPLYKPKLTLSQVVACYQLKLQTESLWSTRKVKPIQLLNRKVSRVGVWTQTAGARTHTLILSELRSESRHRQSLCTVAVSQAHTIKLEEIRSIQCRPSATTTALLCSETHYLQQLVPLHGGFPPHGSASLCPKFSRGALNSGHKLIEKLLNPALTEPNKSTRWSPRFHCRYYFFSKGRNSLYKDVLCKKSIKVRE